MRHIIGDWATRDEIWDANQVWEKKEKKVKLKF